MKYTIPLILIAMIALAFIKDERGESYLTKIISSPMKKAEQGKEVVNTTKGIMEKRDKEIESYMNDEASVNNQILEEGYGNKKAQ